jgi:hypothetical protein
VVVWSTSCISFKQKLKYVASSQTPKASPHQRFCSIALSQTQWVLERWCAENEKLLFWVSHTFQKTIITAVPKFLSFLFPPFASAGGHPNMGAPGALAATLQTSGVPGGAV